MDKVWYPIPIHVAVVDILSKKGSINDFDPFKELERKYNDLSYRELNRALMRLELRGVIRVSRLLKNKKIIEFALDNG